MQKSFKNISEQEFEEIIENLKPNIEKIANKYYISGYEKEDIYQEAYIGVLSALKYFNKNKNNNFYAFANLAIERRIIMLLKKSKRQKNMSLTSSVSLDKEISKDTSNAFIDYLKTDTNFIEDLKTTDLLDQKKAELNKYLSEMEKDVFNYYLRGYKYKEIAEILKTEEKAVDNALQRIKNKSKKIK